MELRPEKAGSDTIIIGSISCLNPFITLGMNPASQRCCDAHIPLRSTHPNQVRQMDPPLCLLYYTPVASSAVSASTDEMQPASTSRCRWTWRRCEVPMNTQRDTRESGHV